MGKQEDTLTITNIPAGADGFERSRARPRLMWRAFIVLALAVGVVPSSALAQGGGDTGVIVGRVVSDETGEPISGAHVQLEGTDGGALSNMDGRYMIRGVPAGLHTLVAQVIGFGRKTVTGVEVTAGATTSLDISVSPQAVAVEGITVSASIERGSTTALLGERRKSPVVVDAIGRDQIARSTDGDAAAVLARAPGVSVVDGKYVYVRGLGERYGSATLNGSALPSPEPDRKTVPLNIVPSDFLESVITAKTYSPNQPGDYAGGLVQIRTRDFPAQQLFKIGLGTSYHSESTGRTGLMYGGGDLDFLAMPGGSRDLPALGPDRIDSPPHTEEALERIGEQFIGPWAGEPTSIGVPQSFSLALGNEVGLWGGDVPVGYLVAVNQSTGWNHRDNLIERVFKAAETPEVDYTGTSTTRSAELGGLFNLAVDVTPSNRLSLSAIYNRTSSDNARYLIGEHQDFGSLAANYRVQYLSQALFSTQLKGRHLLSWLGDTRVEWRGAASRASRYEPNTRDAVYRERGDVLTYTVAKQSGSIFHADLEEWTYGGGLDVAVPFEFRDLPATLSFGGTGDYSDRENFLRRFRFELSGSLPLETLQLPPNQLFTAENIGPHGLGIQEVTFPEDNYEADQTILAGYALLDVELLPRLRVVGGARLEDSDQFVQPVPRFVTIADSLAPAENSNTDLLPGVNLTYEVTDGMNVRLAASRTLARPQFREMAPFGFTDYAGGFLTIGNPALERTLIENYDVRWEWFPTLGSLMAVSGFYKKFDGPIEAAALPSNELVKTWVNAASAENYGVELELRTNLGFLARSLETLSLNTNVSLIRSEVSAGDSAAVWLPLEQEVGYYTLIPRERPLQGQSPYTVNVSLGYLLPSLGTNVTLMYNRIGERIDAVGARTLPDIYEEARGVMDLVIEQPLGRGLSAKLGARNLLGSDVEFTQADRVVRWYDPGRVFSLSASWDLGG